MSLRANTYVVLMSSLFIALAMVFAGLLFATRANVVNIELRGARSEMSRVLEIMHHEQTMLDGLAADWSGWDDAYRFVGDGNQVFVDANFPPDELSTIDVNAFLFLDTHGRVVWARSQGLGAAGGQVPAELYAQLVPTDLRNGPVRGATMRTLIVDGQVVIESVRPILPTNGLGPAAGTLMIARAVDMGQVKRLAGSTGNAITVVDAPMATGLGAEAMSHLTSPSPVWISLTRPHDLVGFALLGGSPLGPTPAVLLSTPIRSLGYEGTPPLIAVLVVALVVVGMAWSNITYQLIERTSLSRISWLREAVAFVGSSADPAERIDMTAAPTGDEVFGVATEINTMLEALEASRRAQSEGEERMRSLVENMADALIVLDLDGHITFASRHVAELTGYSADELPGTDYRVIVAPESRPVVERMLGRGALVRGSIGAEVTFVSREGTLTPVELSTSPVYGADGALAAIQWIARDITERKMFEEQLVHLADHDYLTGLYNRRRFEEELERQLAESRRQGTTGALLWLDLDGFKEINDSLGHSVGDDILVAMATKLRSSSRADQVVARLGGDEFGVLLPHATLDQAEAAAARVLGEVRTGVNDSGGADVWITASIGVVTFPEHGTSVEELSSHADLAMYNAKREGRNRYSTYQPEQTWQLELTERRGWANRIEAALAEERLVAYAQPIRSAADGEIVCYELLVRMKTEDGSIIGPAEFLTAAEGLGLVNDIDLWMIGEAVRLVAAADKIGRSIKVDVNLSATTFGDQGLLRYVKSEIAEAGIEPARLGFEITETALIRNIGRALRFMNELRAIGCSFSLDDFGSGFTSFYHLRHMPLDVLKIDGSLILDLPRSTLDQHLVRAMIELSRGLDIRSTAECVEDQATLDMLRELGIDRVQGMHIGAPAPADAMLLQPLTPTEKRA